MVTDTEEVARLVGAFLITSFRNQQDKLGLDIPAYPSIGATYTQVESVFERTHTRKGYLCYYDDCLLAVPSTHTSALR